MEKALSASLKPNEYLAAAGERMSLIKKTNEYNQNYIVYRIGLKAIEIDQKVRDTMLEYMNQGKKFIQVDDYTIMLNSINAIEPMPIKKKIEKGHFEGDIWVVDK